MGVCCSKPQGSLDDGAQASPSDVKVETSDVKVKADLPSASPKRDKSSGKLQNLQRAASQGSTRAQAELAKLEESFNALKAWLEAQCNIIDKSEDYARALQGEECYTPVDLHDLDDWPKIISPVARKRIERALAAVKKPESCHDLQTLQPEEKESSTAKPEAAAPVASASLAKQVDAGVDKAEERLELAQFGLNIAKAVVMIGTSLPLVGGAFGICKDILSDVQRLKDKADDVAEAGRRVVEVLEFLEALPACLEKLAAEKRAQVEAKMEPLKSLLLDFRECVRTFGEKGWYKRAWGMRKHVKTLAKLDKQITLLLKSARSMFDLARGDRMLELLQERTYALESKIDRRIQQAMTAKGLTEEAAVKDLVADPVVVCKVATAAGVSEDVFRAEIGEFRAEMGQRFDETQEMLRGYGKVLTSVEAKLGMLEKIISSEERISLYVAIASPPNLLRQEMIDLGRMHILQEAADFLTKRADKYLAERQSRPVYLTQVGGHLADDLLRVHCLVWSGMGLGWEAGGAFTFDDLLGALRSSPGQQQRRPIKLAVVCLKYGARAAAQLLIDAGVPVVIWLPVDCGDGKGLEKTLLPSLLPRASLPRGAGILPADAKLPDLRKSREEERPVVNLAQSGARTNLLGRAMARLLSELEPLSDDLDAIDGLRTLLEGGERVWRVISIARSGSAAQPQPVHESHHYRCRAIAHTVCRSFLAPSRNVFDVVYRVASPSDAQAMMLAVGDAEEEEVSCLVWIDAEMQGSLADPAADELVAFMKERPSMCVVVTAEPNSERRLRGSRMFERFTVKTADGLSNVIASDRHDEIKLFAASQPDGTPYCLLDLFEPLQLVEALKTQLPGERPVAALYRDDDFGCLVRICVSDVGYLHELRDTILALNDEFELQLQKELTGRVRKADAPFLGQLRISADRTRFAEQYERAALSLTKLTPHQEDKLEECKEKNSNAFKPQLHIMAPAGAGKTFVALYIILDALKQNGAAARVLFVARNESLCLFMAKWIAERHDNDLEREEALGAVHLLYEPFEDRPRAVWHDAETGKLVTDFADSPPATYDVVCVDEAHHIYRIDALRQAVDVRASAVTLPLCATMEPPH